LEIKVSWIFLRNLEEEKKEIIRKKTGQILGRIILEFANQSSAFITKKKKKKKKLVSLIPQLRIIL
jgi:hypothetical protein